MKFYKSFWQIGIWLLFMISCQEVNHSIPVVQSSVRLMTLDKGDTLLSRVNGKYFYRNQLFNGCIEERNQQGTLVSRQNFIGGREEGWAEWFYPGGQLLARRYYHDGEKDSIHRGWWPNGQAQFEYHFHAGTYQGWFKEWYASGRPLKAIWFDRGQEQYGKGWRENGKIYMSFEVRNGRLYGLVNPNLCYSLINERGEYVRSVPE
jgi:antitoxin component YwqK of YwqJK toxin-antitoxin module